MKKLLSLWFAFALSAALAQDSHIAGRWQMTMETPHGTISGPFDVQQEGKKLTGTFQTEMFGAMPAAGSLDGAKVSFTLSVPNTEHKFTFSGAFTASKMSGETEMGGAWSATRDSTVRGTVTDFRVKSLELAIKPDSGAPRWVKFGPETEVLKIAPGETNLSRAQPAKIADIAREDRVLVSFVDGMEEARRIVVVTETAIERRDAAERLDWEKRGTSGVVAAREGHEITLETRTPDAVLHTTVVVTAKTSLRRYAPDSIKFADAAPAKLDEIAVGDQVRVRGDRSADGSRLTADDLVFGTFRTTLGSISAVDHEHGEMTVVDSVSKRTLTVRLTADTKLKKLPDQESGHQGHSAPSDLAQMLASLPAASVDDLKPGSSVVVTSTRGTHEDRVTGIMVIAHIEGLLQMAQAQAPGESPIEALNRMHGGMLGGPGGVSLPAILQ